MKWFKHDSDASHDAKLRRLRMKYGMEGYGLYWYCLELISRNVEAHNLTFELEHDAELIASDTGMHYEKVQEMMRTMVELQLFEQNSGVITCLKMATRTDEYTAKLIKQNNILPSVPTLSRQTPDNRETKSVLIEEKRREKNIVRTTPDGVSPDVFKDFQEIRKAKRSPFTVTALKGMEREAKKAGYSLNEAMVLCCERGWQSFKSDWVDKKSTSPVQGVDYL